MANYEIMNKNIVTAVWNNNELTVIEQELMPLFLKKVSNADLWLESRAIDSHRANSRLLKKALRLAEKDDISTVIRANGATITDTYWVRPIGSTLNYEDISFDKEYFNKLTVKAASNLALTGNYQSYNYVFSHKSANSPELTNIGSFEKCWKLIDGKWWLLKKATANEIFTEIFTSRLCDRLGIHAATYEKSEKSVKSLDFTNGAMVCFEPAVSFMGENEEYEDVITALKDICPIAIEDYVKMIFIDALIANPDRHTANFGLLKDPDTGKILGFAPLFDHNMALISHGYPNSLGKSDMLITLYAEVIRKHPEYRQYVPVVTREVISETIKEVGMNVRSKFIEDYVYSRYELIQAAIK